MKKSERDEFLRKLADLLEEYDAHVVFGCVPLIDVYGRDHGNHGIVIKCGDEVVCDPDCWTLTAENIRKEIEHGK